MNELVAGVVQRIVEGKHGAYVVVSVPEVKDGSVTFSLDRSVWKEKRLPERGVVVVLSELQKKRGGWRALHARFFKLSDEKERGEQR